MDKTTDGENGHARDCAAKARAWAAEESGERAAMLLRSAEAFDRVVDMLTLEGRRRRDSIAEAEERGAHWALVAATADDALDARTVCREARNAHDLDIRTWRR